MYYCFVPDRDKEHDMEIRCDCGKKLIWTETSDDSEPGKPWVFNRVIEVPPSDNIFELKCTDCDLILLNVYKGPLPEGREMAQIQINVD